jgi:flagellar hook protein FlgE
MAFEQGLSGLNASSKSLDVIGNNIANAQTVGFKASEAQFADVYAASLNGSGSGQVGIGTKLSAVVQQFTQGNITATSNPLDIAISGAGFFRMSDNGVVTYTRNGQFQLDKNGFIVNAQGAQLTGYMVNSSGALSTGAPVPLQINTADIPPKVTGNVSAVLNLDSREAIPTVTPFNPLDTQTYNRTTSVSVFDSLGNSHNLQTFYVKLTPTPASPPGTEGTWAVYATLDGTPVPSSAPDPGLTNPAGGQIGVLAFDTTGKLDPANSIPVSVPLFSFPSTLDPVTTVDGAAAQNITVNFLGTTQFGAGFSVNALKQDGYTSGKLSKFSTGTDGTILGTYTNGQTAVLGQVVLANFTDPNGLQPIGDNQWIETSASGPPLSGVPSSSGLGKLTSQATEDSNTDLTAELVNMITAQRDYQANAQTIKTEDQILQTLVNLR